MTVNITCPAWCDEDPGLHAGELLDWDGACLHRSREVLVQDPSGLQRGLEPPRPRPLVQLVLAAATQPNGRPVESPVVIMDGHELSIEQAEALAGALLEMVGAAR